jgi:hypothetical protein
MDWDRFFKMVDAMSEMSQSRRFRDVRDMSALAPTTAVMMQCGERQRAARSGHHGLRGESTNSGDQS